MSTLSEPKLYKGICNPFDKNTVKAREFEQFVDGLSDDEIERLKSALMEYDSVRRVKLAEFRFLEWTYEQKIKSTFSWNIYV